MGVRVKIGGKVVETSFYRVSESSTPLAGGDSSGGVGTIEIDVAGRSDTFMYLEKPIEFADTSRGSTLGTIRDITQNNRGLGKDHFTANSRLGEFNIETQVQPFSGTLENAFLYYCSLANIVGNVMVDDALKTRQVAFPGWYGNLWVNMKQMAMGVGADLNLISNNVILRPVRVRTAVQGRDTDSSVNVNQTSLALKQEVIWYNTQYRTASLIYPAGGWTSGTKVLSVNAGQTVETVLDSPDVAASISAIQQPVMQTFVGPGESSSSVYTVVGDDNLPIVPAQWRDYGGKLDVIINPDTTSLTVRMTGPTGLAQINGSPMQTFRIALSAGTSDSTYSTLRIVGNAVHLNRQSIIIPTGVEPYRTAQEFAPTIDNIFLNNLNDAYNAGALGAARYSGKTFSLSSTVTAINQRGVNGDASYPTYGFVQNLWSGRTYGQVKTQNTGKTYAQVKSDLYALVANNFENQLFGNAPGARVYDRGSKRWYRIRDANTQWDTTSIEADSDILFGDIKKVLTGKTYGQVKVALAGKSYFDADLLGLGLAG